MLLCERGHRWYINEWAWMCTNKTLFIHTQIWISCKFNVWWNGCTNIGGVLDLICRLWFSDPWSSQIVNILWRTSIVVQWIRTCLLIQGTRVQSLVQEDSTCLGATKPMNYNYWACKLQLLRPRCLESVLHKRSHCNEKSVHHVKEQPPLATTRGSLSTATKTQCNEK